MMPQNRDEFVADVHTLHAVFRKTVADDVIEWWWDALKPHEFELVRRAMRGISRSNRFCPTLHEVRALVQETSGPSRGEDTSAIRCAYRANGQRCPAMGGITESTTHSSARDVSWWCSEHWSTRRDPGMAQQILERNVRLGPPRAFDWHGRVLGLMLGSKQALEAARIADREERQSREQ